MYMRPMVYTPHVHATHGLNAYVLATRDLYATCTCDPWFIRHMYMRPMVYTPHVLATHGLYATCTCDPWFKRHMYMRPMV